MQLSLLDLMRSPPIRRPVEPDGGVILGEIDEIHRLPHPRLAWDMAAIQLHKHEDGLWMWAVQTASGGYRVGPKWGQFAASREDALHYAVEELSAKLDRMIARPDGYSITLAQMRKCKDWAEALT